MENSVQQNARKRIRMSSTQNLDKHFIAAFNAMEQRQGVRDITINKSNNGIMQFLKLAGLNINSSIREVMAIPDETYHQFLDDTLAKARAKGKTGDSTHNQRLIYLNKIRYWLGLPNLDRSRRKVEEHQTLDLEDASNAYQRIFDLCDNDRDRVILAIMRYGGLRVGEVAILAKEGFKFKTDYVKLHFYRPKVKRWDDIVMIEPVALIESYVNSTNGILFPQKQNKSHGIGTEGIYDMVANLAAKAGVKILTHPHNFRHYRATELGGNGYSKWDLDNIFGWSKNSKTANIYVNLSSKDTNNKLLARSGVQNETKKEMIKKCERCHAVLLETDHRCRVCGFSVNPVENLQEIQKLEEMSMEAINERMKKLERLLEERDNA